MSEPLRVPFTVPDLDDREIDAVTAVLRSGWLTSGPQAAAFEKEFGEYAGARHAAAVSSCTTGLHVSLTALGIGPGDEVITTPLTFSGTIQSIEETGSRAVLADIGTDLNIDPESIRAMLTPRTRAILPVHIAGKPCDMRTIWDLAKPRGIFVVEDAAHAVGTEYHGEKIGGTASDATVFSFYATKNVTSAEGGMITTPRADFAARVRLMANHGILRHPDRQSWQYEVVERGFKYNLSDVHAAIGRVQLQKLEAGIAARTRIAKRYADLLSDCPAIELPCDAADGRHSWHLFIVRLDLDQFEISRDEFTAELARRGVGTSVHFIPIPLHPYFRDRFPDHARLEVTMREFPRLISLPMYPGLSDEQVEYTARCVREVSETNRKRVVAMPGAMEAREQ
ncbi:MAG: DegT/DnrJ/EryC1/StrS aminotransferase family protein [Bryobacteraceae bacterium]